MYVDIKEGDMGGQDGPSELDSLVTVDTPKKKEKGVIT